MRIYYFHSLRWPGHESGLHVSPPFWLMPGAPARNFDAHGVNPRIVHAPPSVHEETNRQLSDPPRVGGRRRKRWLVSFPRSGPSPLSPGREVTSSSTLEPGLLHLLNSLRVLVCGRVVLANSFVLQLNF